jgi:hypothetical protein
VATSPVAGGRLLGRGRVHLVFRESTTVRAVAPPPVRTVNAAAATETLSGRLAMA